jgi:hypothetical protein
VAARSSVRAAAEFRGEAGGIVCRRLYSSIPQIVTTTAGGRFSSCFSGKGEDTRSAHSPEHRAGDLCVAGASTCVRPPSDRRYARPNGSLRTEG